MKYMELIHQGTTPTPPSDEWESLSDDENGLRAGASTLGGPLALDSGITRV
jgi:hypothetical protein